MKTVAIPESEFQKIMVMVAELQAKLNALKAVIFQVPSANKEEIVPSKIEGLNATEFDWPKEGPVPNQFGIFKGQIWMSPDFDEPLEEFKEYME